MASKYALITYPEAEPVLAQMDGRRVLGHGFTRDLVAAGCTITHLVEMPPERVSAIERAAKGLRYFGKSPEDAQNMEILEGILADIS